MTRPKIEPRSPGPLANTLPAGVCKSGFHAPSLQVSLYRHVLNVRVSVYVCVREREREREREIKKERERERKRERERERNTAYVSCV